MPSSSTPEVHDQQLLSIGKQCSDPACLLVDFLPFKCQHCEQHFCGDHFMVTAHKCPKYDESKYNRVAPNCPLCNDPVAIRPGQDPNVRMEDHFARECSVMTGKSGKTKSAPVCARGKCGKVLFAPIRCDKCKEQFCPAHRFPTDHNCSAPAPATLPTSKTTAFGAANLHAKNLNTKASAATAATVGAIKKNLASVGQSSTPRSPPTPAPKSPTTAKPSTPSSHANPFSKADRRAKAERESRRKAMHERAKKGLLSEEEKAILAAEEAERAQHSREKKGDCVVM